MTPKDPFLEGTFWGQILAADSLPGAFVHSRFDLFHHFSFLSAGLAACRFWRQIYLRKSLFEIPFKPDRVSFSTPSLGGLHKVYVLFKAQLGELPQEF